MKNLKIKKIKNEEYDSEQNESMKPEAAAMKTLKNEMK